MLAAEILWINYLIVTPNSISQERKLDNIKRVWGWSQRSLPEEHWALDIKVLTGGVAELGMGKIHQWREFRFIIVMMLHWWQLRLENRESLLNNPWGFAEWIFNCEDGEKRCFPHAVLFLLFPDEFEPIVSLSHKKEIVEGFQESASNFDLENITAIDRELHNIRTRLEETRQEREINFFEPPWRERWKDDAPSQNQNFDADRPDYEEWYRSRFGNADVWVIAPGDGARLWSNFLNKKIAAIGWDPLGDLSRYELREDMHAELIENGFGPNPKNNSLAVWEFVHEVKVGDFVLAKEGRNKILGWGRWKGDYAYDEERPEYCNIRAVEWHPCQKPVKLRDQIPVKTLTKVTDYKDWLWRIFNSIDAEEKAGKKSTGEETITEEPYDLGTAMRDLFLEETRFQRILNSIAQRKNLILQAPPPRCRQNLHRQADCMVFDRAQRYKFNRNGAVSSILFL